MSLPAGPHYESIYAVARIAAWAKLELEQLFTVSDFELSVPAKSAYGRRMRAGWARA
jgi:hypothetical protein